MKLRNISLTSALAIVLGTAAAAQMTQPSPPTTGPTTTQTTTTQTEPATTTAPSTTTQSTTTQTQPATTTDPATTTTTETTTTQTGAIAQATEADITKGASVYDQNGELVGKVDSVSASGAIVSTGKARAEIPISSFGKNDKGLVVGITKADLDAQAKTKTTTTETKTKTKTKTETEPKSD